MTGPAAAEPGVDDAAVLRQHAEGSAAVAELVADGLDDWLVDRLRAAGEQGMHINAIAVAVWRRYGRAIGPIFLEEVCSRLVGEGRISAGPGWLDYRARKTPQAPAAEGVAGQEGKDT